MMGVIVGVCVAFGLTVSKIKAEIICLRTKGMPDSTAIFSVEAANLVCKQTNVFASTTLPTCPSRSTSVYALHGAAFRGTPSNCTTDQALPSSSRFGC